MLIAIISIVAAIFLALYVSKSQDLEVLDRDNKWLKEQRDRMPDPVTVDETGLRPLDKESIMEAIRFNGFVPEATGDWNCNEHSKDVDKLINNVDSCACNKTVPSDEIDEGTKQLVAELKSLLDTSEIDLDHDQSNYEKIQDEYWDKKD